MKNTRAGRGPEAKRETPAESFFSPDNPAQCRDWPLAVAGRAG